MRVARQQPGRLPRFTLRAIEVGQIQKRNREIDSGERQRRIDAQSLAKLVGRGCVVELFELRDADVVRAIRLFARL